MTDETRADDGAIFAFWAFVERRRAEPNPPAYAFALDQPGRLRDAVAAFDGLEP